MSSNGYDTPLRLELLPSNLLQRYLLTVHLVSLLAALLPMQLPWMVNLTMLLIVYYSAWRVWSAMARRHAAVKPLWVWRHHAQWHDVLRQTDWRLQTVRLLSPWLVIVELRAETGATKQLLCIWKDQLSPALYRDLYCRLKFWRAETDQPLPGI